MHWIDGLVGAARMMQVMEAFRNLFVLHGHLHHIIDQALSCGIPRIFQGDGGGRFDQDAPRVRLYDVRDRSAPAPAGLVVS